jgi:hypothetical protein
LETRDVVALGTAQIASLTTSQIVALTIDQVTALTTTQVCALTAAQNLAFTTDQSPYLAIGSPLILDLNGDGITTQNIAAGVEFDLFASGQKVHTGWVGSGDGLLVMDRNHDGLINDGNELFGTATTLADGKKAANGYVALAALDTNGDGLMTRADAGFADLRIWVDGNSDGVSQTGEVRTLDSFGVAKLDLAATISWENNNGNFEGLVSSYETTDGARHAMADVWFVANKNEYANIAPVVTALNDDLSFKVGGLVDAIGAFNESASTMVNPVTMPGIDSLPPAGVASVTVAGVAAAVNGIVDALKQFDPNGNTLVASAAIQSVPGLGSLTAPALPNPVSAGILAVGK